MKGNQQRSNEANVAYWRAHIAAWRKSGFSQTCYSREHGISQSSLSYWIQRLKTGLPPAKLPIIFEISPAAVVQALRPEHAPAPLTLTIAGRYQLDIRDDFRAQALEKVVRTPERL